MKLRLLILADINSPHTQKWARGLATSGIEIGIFSLNDCHDNWHESVPGITYLNQKHKAKRKSTTLKILYLFQLLHLHKCIAGFNPHIVHAHYATSYGLLGALTFFKPFVVSAWGSDILKFPRKSLFHRRIIKFVLKRADKICVTSRLLRTEIRRYTVKPCEVIPFGVDLSSFYNRKSLVKDNRPFTLGMIKHLEKIYNPDIVIGACNILATKFADANFKLIFCGSGKMNPYLMEMARKTATNLEIEFAGRIPNKDVPIFLNNIDVLVNIPDYESFGVNVAEAMACKVPVILSDYEGLSDLAPGNEFALKCPPGDVLKIAEAMESYYINPELRINNAEKAFSHIRNTFNLQHNLQQMKSLYYNFTPGLSW